MDEEREQLVTHILEASRLFYLRSLQLGGDREWAEVDLTMPQLKVLFVVAASQGLMMTQLARSVGMTLSTATGVADRLIAQGLVRREHDPTDRRLVLLRATDTGLDLVDRLIRVGETQFRLVAGRITTDELRLLAQAYDIICRAMLEISEERQASSPSILRGFHQAAEARIK